MKEKSKPKTIKSRKKYTRPKEQEIPKKIPYIRKKSKRENESNILGYSGYVWAINSENLYGKSKCYLT